MPLKKSQKRARQQLFKDLLLIAIGAIVGIILSRIGLIDWLVAILGGNVLASFIAGIFFTSAFTIAPATVGLAHLAGSLPAGTIALWGALGAVCGDLVLFFYIRDRFADDVMQSMRPSLVKHIVNSFHLGFLKWLSPIIGALIIASPIPDEFGLALMGLSKTRLSVLIPVSFAMNMLGIYLIIWFAHIV